MLFTCWEELQKIDGKEKNQISEREWMILRESCWVTIFILDTSNGSTETAMVVLWDFFFFQSLS